MLTLKWGLIRDRKKEFIADAVERASRRHAAEKWVKHAKSFLVLKQVFETYSDARHKYYRQRLVHRSALLVQRVWKTYRKRLSTESMRKTTKPHGRYTVD